MNKTPAVRFKGFTEEWEQRKLLDCIQKITDFRGRTPKKLGMDWSESGYLALSALNVKDGYIDFSQDVHYGDQALYDKWMSGNELHKGQVLFTTEAPMGNVAQVPDNRRYILSQRTIAFDTKPNLITEKFLATVLRTPTVFAALTALSSGGTAKGVSQKSLATVDITIPADLDEQEQLASMLSRIDNLITLHQRKYEKLVNIKKSMLYKMFPQNGSKVPEIRFSGFTGDWEQRKVSEITSFHKQGFYTTETYNEKKKYYLLRGTDMTGNRLILKDTPKINATESDYKAFKAQVGDFLIVRSGTVGTYGIVYEDIPAIFGSYLIDFRFDKSQVTNEFFGYFYQSDLFTNQLRQIIQQSANTNINAENIKSTSIKIPSIPEQNKIGKYFSNLDNLIALYQRKLEKLKQIKQAMLHKMFV